MPQVVSPLDALVVGPDKFASVRYFKGELQSVCQKVKAAAEVSVTVELDQPEFHVKLLFLERSGRSLPRFGLQGK